MSVARVDYVHTSVLSADAADSVIVRTIGWRVEKHPIRQHHGSRGSLRAESLSRPRERAEGSRN